MVIKPPEKGSTNTLRFAVEPLIIERLETKGKSLKSAKVNTTSADEKEPVATDVAVTLVE